MGGDGWQQTTYGRVSRDVYGFKLGYFSNDYTPIGGATAGAFGNKTYSAPGTLDQTGNELFNGNISFTMLALSKLVGAATTGYSYGYDQLNRLVEMRQHSTGTTSGWSNSSIVTAYRESISYDANGNILKYLRKGHSATPHMDSLTYQYNYSSGKLINNRLNHVSDSIPAGNYSEDIDDQDAGNYQYDYIGNLRADGAEKIDTIRWTVYGKINRIVKSEDNVSIDYSYDAAGNRTGKRVNNNDTISITWYVRDAQGNVMAVYSNKEGTEDIVWKEQHLYGSSRLGMWRADTTVPALPPVVDEDPVYDSVMLGSRTYELTNHLGNVLATISDKKIGNDSSDVVNYYIAEVLSQTDYYPGGMVMPGRKYSSGSEYRYGAANGQEKSTEINDNSYTADYWQYDARLVRRWNVDPIFKEYESPYAAYGGNPIWFSDLGGADTSKPAGLLNRFMNLVEDGQSGKLQMDIVKGAANAGKDAVVGTWNFVTRDAYKGSTYNGMASSIVAFSSWSSGGGENQRMLFDIAFGLNSQAAYNHYKEKFDVSKWSNEDWSYNITSAGILFFGPKAVKANVGEINTAAATAYMKYAYGGRYATAAVSGTPRFTLKLGLSENLIYHSSKERAVAGKWSSETIFTNSDDAFNSLGLDYPNATNTAQKVFTSRAVGIYVESKAAQMGSTSGGASQLLKTKLSFTSNIKETRYPAFSLKTGYQWRGSYIIGKK